MQVDDLVRKSGVSQTPIRQATMRLQGEGLVTNIRNSGFRASESPTKQHLIQTLEVRDLLEPNLARMAAENISKPDNKDVSVLLSKALDETKYEVVFYRKFFNLDIAFHKLKAIASGNEVANAALNTIRKGTTVFIFYFRRACLLRYMRNIAT